MATDVTFELAYEKAIDFVGFFIGDVANNLVDYSYFSFVFFGYIFEYFGEFKRFVVGYGKVTGSLVSYVYFVTLRN